MAKVQFGGLVSQVSGSVGGTTYSRNRYGTYARRRAHPTVSQTSYALDAKSRLGDLSRAWSALSVAKRAAWSNWAANNPVTDKLGAKQVVAGNAAYVMLNGRLVAAGLSAIDVPPVGFAPPALDTVALTADIGAGDFEVVFTATPLGTNDRIWVQAAVTGGDSQVYVKNKLRLIGVSAAALASPLDELTLPGVTLDTLAARLAARFGTLAIGQLITLYLSVLDGTTGLLSTPMITEDVVLSSV